MTNTAPLTISDLIPNFKDGQQSLIRNISILTKRIKFASGALEFLNQPTIQELFNSNNIIEGIKLEDPGFTDINNWIDDLISYLELQERLYSLTSEYILLLQRPINDLDNDILLKHHQMWLETANDSLQPDQQDKILNILRILMEIRDALEEVSPPN